MRALDQQRDATARAIADFAADPLLRKQVIAEEDQEDRAVRRAADLLVHGVSEAGWSAGLVCAAQTLVVRVGRGADRFPGRIRRAQNWIGDSLESASYVPPPGELLRELVSELVAFLNNSEGFPALVTAALAFAQVVSIHAFNDGNGRLARAVALAVLGLDGTPCELPLNGYLRACREAHLRAIEAVQRRGDWEEWIAFFVQAIAGSTRKSFRVPSGTRWARRKAARRKAEA